jgi:hypothetical protein
MMTSNRITIVVAGAPSSGKTTLIARIKQYCDDDTTGGLSYLVNDGGAPRLRHFSIDEVTLRNAAYDRGIMNELFIDRDDAMMNAALVGYDVVIFTFRPFFGVSDEFVALRAYKTCNIANKYTCATMADVYARTTVARCLRGYPASLERWSVSARTDAPTRLVRAIMDVVLAVDARSCTGGASGAPSTHVRAPVALLAASTHVRAPVALLAASTHVRAPAARSGAPVGAAGLVGAVKHGVDGDTAPLANTAAAYDDDDEWELVDPEELAGCL